MDLVILAGGKGNRIKKLNPYLPKPMIKFGNLNFLQILINHYCKFNFKNIFIIAGYKGNIIKNKFHNTIQNFVKINCIIENKPLDTAGGLVLLKKKIKKDFILINGDTFLNFNNFEKLTKLVKTKKKIAGMILIKSKKRKIKLNNLSINKNKDIIKKKKSDLINAGVYFFTKKIFFYLKKKPISMENHLLPKLIQNKLISGIKSSDYFIDIGTPVDLKKSKKTLVSFLTKPSIFLDRDGVINYDNGYTHKFTKFKFRKNVIKFLKKITKKNMNIFIITNQAGIAKKIFSIEDFFNLHIKLKKYFLRNNIFINDVEFCPHHPQGKIKIYTKICKCRKPSNKMIKNIKKKWFINNKKSIFIGDQKKDMLAASKSKIKFFYVEKDIYNQWNKINKSLYF